MSSRTPLALRAAAPLLLALCPALASASDWPSDLKAAQTQAKESKRPLLIDFTGSDWCRPCMALDKEVLQSEEFQKLAKGLVCLTADYPQRKELPAALKEQNEGLKQRYKIQGFPTLLLVDHAGTEIGRLTGFRPGTKAEVLSQLEGFLAQGFDKETGLAKPPVDPWSTDFAAATAESKKTGKPLLVDFTGSDWCGWCVKLDEEVFSKPEFLAWAKEKVILVKLDFPARKPQPSALKEQNKGLAERYGIEGFPTILFLDAEGKVLGRSGYLDGGPKAWIAAAEQELQGGAKK